MSKFLNGCRKKQGESNIQNSLLLVRLPVQITPQFDEDR